MSDVLIFQTNDNGEICIVDGLVELTDDFRSAVYLSLFGGNEEDDGRDDNELTWWGNLNELDPAKQYRSETEYLLRSLPVTTGNLQRLEDAAENDLQFFIDKGIVKELKIEVSLIGRNKLEYLIELNGDETVTFQLNWKATSEI